ncbi:hypothetical protein D3C72_2236000 [compost metagenome]
MNRFFLLVLTKMPSRPAEISLSTTALPGVFHNETPLPRSATRNSRLPTMRLPRTIASSGPQT